MKKKKEKHGKSGKKFFAALAMSILVISGLAIAVSAIDDNSSSNNPSYGVFKEIKNSPLDLINAEKLLVPQNFDYIEQMNRDFVGKTGDENAIYLPGDSLRELQKQQDESQ